MDRRTNLRQVIRWSSRPSRAYGLGIKPRACLDLRQGLWVGVGGVGPVSRLQVRSNGSFAFAMLPVACASVLLGFGGASVNMQRGPPTYPTRRSRIKPAATDQAPPNEPASPGRILRTSRRR